ncbi:MAG: glycosyltransferase family 4 protein [candidate division Zixibacteria bacterium]|nr:glycosyltransferase family 4 protein [candidate division Zixibacteria bacterium]
MSILDFVMDNRSVQNSKESDATEMKHDPPNILHLINVRWYNACAYYALSLADALKRQGCRIKIAGDPGIPVFVKAKILGLDFDETPRFSSYLPWEFVKNMLWLKRMVINEKFDIIVAHRGEAHTSAMLAKKLFNLNFKLIRVRGDVRVPREDIFNKILYGDTTDGIFCSTDKLKEDYINKFRSLKDNVHTLPTGIDEEYYGKSWEIKDVREKYGLPSQGIVISLLGRLSPVKGHKTFIKMAGIISKHFPDATFLIAGEEFEVTCIDINEMISDFSPKANFKILGVVDDVREILAITDIAVITSLDSEMIPRVALEYMASGKPIVASNINALAEAIDEDKGGYLADPGDFNGFANSVMVLLKDEQKRKDFGSYNKKQAATKYSYRKWAIDFMKYCNMVYRSDDRQLNG